MAPAHSKMIILSALVAGASAFTPAAVVTRSSTALFNGPVLGAGGMADTRDPDALVHEDPRKSISEAPSFEEYLKSRGAAPAAAAPAPAAPAPVAPAAPAWGAPAAAPAAPAWGAPAAAAPAPAPAAPSAPVLGAGGMADTRDPEALVHEDPRKSISEAPSFEEYLKSRGAAPAAAAPAPAAPAPAAPAPAAPAPVAPVAAAPAAPAAPPAQADSNYGAYDDQLWDNAAKKIIYAQWDPSSPRSVMNFNPFETFEGNSPDASGRYPGEPFYKDPMRGDVSYALMLEEKAEAEERAANPKPGEAPGCPGCRN